MSSKRKHDLTSRDRNCNSKISPYIHLTGQNDIIYKRTEIIRDGRKFPDFKKPCVVGVFSIDAERRFILDNRMLKYLHWNKTSGYNGKVYFDLNKGIKSCVRKDESLNEKLDNIFSWLKIEGHQREECKNADFMCYRGLLTLIMSTPYEQKEGWMICASKKKNTIYLCAYDTELKIRQKKSMTEKQRCFMSWGFKFEQYMLADKPDAVPDTDSPVVETEELNCVFRSKLNGHSIVYAAEMDGVNSDVPVDSTALKAGVKFIELKTNRHIETQRQDHNFKRYKLLKWWCQCFLVGIETVYCGFRDDDDGVVSSVKEFRVRDLPKMAKGMWDPCVCMNFCAQFLDFVKGCLQDCPEDGALWRFEWTPGNSITGQPLNGDSEFAFVPHWFVPS